MVASAFVTPLVGVWIEIVVLTPQTSYHKCHSPCGSVDWNDQIRTPTTDNKKCHSPCGSVDWNNQTCFCIVWSADVTPLVGVWIEICPISITEDQIKSLPLWECGLKYLILDGAILKRCHSPCGSVDWNTTCISRFEFTTVTPLVGVWIEIKTAIARLTCR